MDPAASRSVVARMGGVLTAAACTGAGRHRQGAARERVMLVYSPCLRLSWGCCNASGGKHMGSDRRVRFHIDDV